MNKLLLGLLAGFVIGILMAPDKGSETRRKLRNTVNDLSDNLSEPVTDLDSEEYPPKMGAKLMP